MELATRSPFLSRIMDFPLVGATITEYAAMPMLYGTPTLIRSASGQPQVLAGANVPSGARVLMGRWYPTASTSHLRMEELTGVVACNSYASQVAA